ncbi:MAG: amidohydrolase [Clostridiales bacterium]|jgi:amidohydrolase|nr:amidohydrolase [Clostridiales bacterium]
MDYKQSMQEHADWIVDIRRELHTNPELPFQETRTSALVCRELERLGIPSVQLEENCVVGILAGKKTGSATKSLAIRADMDALPVMEETGLPFQSKVPGVMHACGHDGHTAMLLGAAAMLKQQQDELQGTVYFCFQSAEEVGGGAKTIVNYLQEQGGVDSAIAAHLWAELDSGLISLEEGARMSGCDYFKITVDGKGGHASRPDLCLDPIKPLCQIVLNAASIPANVITALEPCVVHVGNIEGGTQGNIFSQAASAFGGIRTFSNESRKRAKEALQSMVENTAAAFGAAGRVEFLAGVPMVFNAHAPIALAQEVIRKTGILELGEMPPLMASENFGEFLAAFPGFMCFIGIRNQEKGLVYHHHHPKFDIDEDMLARGSTFFAAYALAFLR